MSKAIPGITEEKLGFGKGLYAIFEVSHGETRGELVAVLEEEKTPDTVANFVGLATGTKEYTDPVTRDKSTKPFYDQTVFHRIIKDFMIQGGDRLGQGTGGPGYRFKDEFHPTLRHTVPGILSMANSGPNTNGSQFFITLIPCPWLDGKHAVFGKLVKGEDLLQRLGKVATGPGDRPREEMKLERLRIVRES